MKTTVIKLEGIESVLSPAGVEKKMCQHPSIRRDRRDHIEPRDPAKDAPEPVVGGGLQYHRFSYRGRFILFSFWVDLASGDCGHLHVWFVPARGSQCLDVEEYEAGGYPGKSVAQGACKSIPWTG